jgi:hypothetical protein
VVAGDIVAEAFDERFVKEKKKKNDISLLMSLIP